MHSQMNETSPVFPYILHVSCVAFTICAFEGKVIHAQ